MAAQIHRERGSDVVMADPTARGTRVQGMVALVVGGGSTGDYPGTGSATAMLLAAQGARVAVMGRSAERTQRTVDAIAEAGGTAIAVTADVTTSDGCAGAVHAAVGAFGQLDILVNNVAVHDHVSLDDFDEARWDAIFDGNVKAIARMTAHALPFLRASDSGSIVNIGSVAGVQSTGAVGYGTAKGAVEPLTRDLAANLGGDGIRVNCVIPGHLHTPHVDRLGAGGEPMRLLRNQLNVLGTEGDGWDAAWAVVYLASPEARFITGQSLQVDGGLTTVLALVQVMRTRAAPSDEAGS